MKIKRLYQLAEKRKIAIGHFNVSNIETFEAAVRASKKTKKPIIIAVSEGAIEHSGLEFFVGAKDYYENKYNIELFLHLDHGYNLDIIGEAIHGGFDSVMFDGSHLDFSENVRLTRSIVNQAHRYGAAVEAEIGSIGGDEENVKNRKIIFTDPLLAQDFVKKTNCDMLAVAIGTSHGIHKFLKKSELDFKLLEVLRKVIPVPLVLHGASMVRSELVMDLKERGVKINNAIGVSAHDLKKAIGLGIRKINVDTDLQLAMIVEILDNIYDGQDSLKLYKLLNQAGKAMEEEVIRHIKLFSSK
ncbi:class II fructose-bisphosphate aldolase [Candidatus Microgenomates bacterium]|nr:class II fructose-bisphosphate aldolase [Candidatus Microgenomates bacterium]